MVIKHEQSDNRKYFCALWAGGNIDKALKLIVISQCSPEAE